MQEELKGSWHVERKAYLHFDFNNISMSSIPIEVHPYNFEIIVSVLIISFAIF